ncbi:MAG: hypothetical protein AB1772_08485 [Candidatus Zixiibacteriota bacterium]
MYSAGGAAAAAAKRRREQKEEEEMTRYNSGDLSGWEFKIVRSATGRFSSREAVQSLCAEEARAGWELLEKFDNSRIRFKRRIERRAQDQTLAVDPYRTHVGISEGGLAFVIIGVIVAVALAAVLVGSAMK